MKSLGFGLLSVFLVSCAHQVKAPHMVSLPYAEELLEKVQKTGARRPASVPTFEMAEVSPRRVYFSALYEQYRTLDHYLGQNEMIKSCPQFHNEKNAVDKKELAKLEKESWGEGKDNRFFPEKTFNKESFVSYHQNVKSEIVTLCEDGVSDNYYKYENLVTHFANSGAFHRSKTAMKSLLKIPVFANYYIVEMMSAVPHHEKKFIELSKAQWFENYVSEAGHQRKNLLKEFTAQR